MKRVLVASLLALGVLVSTTIGHAAALTLTGGSIGSYSVTGRCTSAVTGFTNGTPTSTGSATSVVMTIPAGCHDVAGQMRLVGIAGATDITFTVPAPGATTVTVPVPGGFQASSVTGVALTLGTWGMPTQWTYTPPVAPPSAGPISAGSTNTVLTQTWQLLDGGMRFCVDIAVSSSTTGRWVINLNINERPFNGATSGFEMPGYVKLVSATPVGGVLQLERAGANGDRAESFSLCMNTPPPVYDPTLVYTVNQGPVVGDTGNACITSTVTVTGTPTFYAGWRADIDMSAAIALVSSGGQTFSGVYASGDSFTLLPLTANVWQVSGAHYGNYGIRDGMTRTVVLCAN